MASLDIAADFLIGTVFKGDQPYLRIVGARYDHAREVLTLDIEGPGVPDVEHVRAVVTKERFSVRFEKADAT